MSITEQHLLDHAREAIDHGDFSKAVAILDALINKQHNPEAMFLRAQFGIANESEESFNKRRIQLLNEASVLGHVNAIYELSMHLEEGDLIPQDKIKATSLLWQAADAGHPHAMWRIGLMLVYGAQEQQQDINRGLALIERAAALKSQGALRSLAEFYAEGKFGYAQNAYEANRLLMVAEGDGVVLL
jgi:TPR repeat protein